MKRLDEQMRRRLRALAQQELPEALSPSSRQRIVQRVQERSTVVRVPWWALTMAASLVVAILWSRSRGDDDHVSAARPAPVGAEAAPEVDAPHAEAAPIDTRPCSEAEVPEAREERWRGGRRTIDLPGRARFVLFRGARGELEHEACRTILTLTEGRVLVHASDLMGGELVVRTPSDDVVVHGTVFDVRLARGDGLAVGVAEGEVGVGETRVSAGRAYARDDAGERLRVLASSEARAMMETLQNPAVPRVEPTEQAVPPRVPRGEVVGGVPRVHEPPWSRREEVP